MSDTVKTMLFATVAVVAVLVTVFTYPRQEEYRAPDLLGKPLFADFKDPSVASQLLITKFSEDLGQLTEFEVVRDAKTGLWSIPSSANYPADAEAQMRDAATSLIDLQVLGLASTAARDHQVYGVVEPDKNTLQASQQGVGLAVTVKDAKGKDLARLIIGKRVKGTEDQYFVRRPGEEPVYVVKIDPSKFPTEFDKWIERDLLKVNTLDVDRLTFKDYSVITAGGRGSLEERYEATVSWNSDQSKWELDNFDEFQGRVRKPSELLPTEELDTQKLNDLKTALGNLKIVDVLRKPEGLGADLKAGKEVAEDDEGLLSLQNRGFYLAALPGGERELRAANGEVLVGLKDGVQYVLRFGEVASVGQEGADSTLNRYLFVSARLDESKFPPLELQPLPGGEEAPAATTTETSSAPVVSSEPAADAPDAAPEASTGTNSAPEADESPSTNAAGADSGQDAAAADAAEGSTAPATEPTDLELERERVRKENQRKQDERDEKLKKARQQISELNARFADWYYVISEDEYKKIRLSRNDLIKEKDTAKELGFGVDALRELEGEGIEAKKPADSAPTPPPPTSFQPQ